MHCLHELQQLPTVTSPYLFTPNSYIIRVFPIINKSILNHHTHTQLHELRQL